MNPTLTQASNPDLPKEGIFKFYEPSVDTMRRGIHWKAKHENGAFCDVRVSFFASKYKFQFRESISEVWDYERAPSRDDLLMLLEIIQRRFHRRQAGPKELKEIQRLLREFDEHLDGSAKNPKAD